MSSLIEFGEEGRLRETVYIILAHGVLEVYMWVQRERDSGRCFWMKAWVVCPDWKEDVSDWV